MAKLNYYNGLWDEMIRNDKDKVDHFKKIDEVIEFGLELPPELKKLKWMRNIQSTLPAEIMVVGRKTLATIGPDVFIQPLNSNAETIRLVNEREQNLLWQFQQMEKRARHGMIGDLVESALRYDAITCFTVPAEWQMKGQSGPMPTRYKAAMNNGGFINIIENPKDVHARYSPLGLDRVLVAKVMRATDAAIYYPEARKLRDAIEAEEEKDGFYVTVYDYWDYDERVVRLSKITRDTEILTAYGGDTIIKEKMELPFLPWTIVDGGTSLASAPEHMARAILSPIVHADQLELQLIVQSMAFAEATGYAAAPRSKTVSYSGDTIEINFGDIQSRVELQPGEEYEVLDPPAIDANLLLIFDRIDASFNRLAGLKALASLDSPSGTAYATVNAQIKAATSALSPAKQLTERAMSSQAEIMLRWTAHTKEPLLGYGAGDDNLGKQYRLDPEHIDPKAIYVDVTLSHHIPTDELQQINAVTMLMKEVGISFVDAAKRLNISNPEEMLERKRQEMLDEAMFANELKKISAQADLAIQAQQMQMQMQAQMVGQAQQMKMQQAAQGGGMNEESLSQGRMAQGGANPGRLGNPRTPPQSGAATGRGFNPARGGRSPNEANPDLTKEGSTGVDRSGNTI